MIRNPGPYANVASYMRLAMRSFIAQTEAAVRAEHPPGRLSPAPLRLTAVCCNGICTIYGAPVSEARTSGGSSG